MPKIKTLWLGAAIFISALLTYSNSLRNGFCWDDHILIENNAFLNNISDLKTLAQQIGLKPVVPITGAARPIFLASLIADHLFWGNNPLGYHLTNIVLHGLNAILVWRTGLLFLPPEAALIAGLTFSIHPINTEAVDLASFRPDLLAVLFMLLGLLAYREMEKAAKFQRTATAMVMSALAYGLGIFSKETALVLPAAAMWFDFCFLEKPWRTSLTRRASVMVIFGLLALHYVRFRSPRSGYKSISPNPEAISTLEKIRPSQILTLRPDISDVVNPSAPRWDALYHSPSINFRTMCVVFAEYFRLMLFPYPLRTDRAPSLIGSWTDRRLWAALIFFALLLSFALWTYTSGLRALSWALGWCLIFLAPVSNIAHLYNPMAERYLYPVSIGICWILGWTVERGLRRLPAQSRQATKFAAITAPCAVLFMLAVMTAVRNKDWASDASLFGHEVALKTDNDRVYYNLGYTKQIQGDLKGAEQDYETAIALNSHDIEALNNLAGLKKAQGNYDAALSLYSRAVSFNPENSLPYDGLGAALERKNDIAGAMTAYQEALQKNPNDIQASLNVARVFASEGSTGWAANQLRDAARRNPQDFDVNYRLASYLDGMGRYQEAEQAWESFLSSHPNDAQALMDLGVVYDHAGNPAQAVQWLKRATAINPDNAAAHYNLGIAQDHLGHPEQAVESLKKALSINRSYLDAAYSLAVIEQKMGRVQEAIAQYKEALSINPSMIEALNNLGGLYQLQGDLSQAKKYLTLALDASPPHPLSLLNNLGNIYLQSGDFDKAALLYRAAIERALPADNAGNLAPTWTNLGVCYYRQGKRTQAEDAWQKAIIASPGYRDAYQWLAQSYRESGRMDQAQVLMLKLNQMNSGTK